MSATVVEHWKSPMLEDEMSENLSASLEAENDWELRGSVDKARAEIAPLRDGRGQSRPDPAAALAALQGGEDSAKKKEWASALLLVQEACDSIRFSEERVEALERELEQAVVQSRDDLKQMVSRLQTAQNEIEAANARADAAEARAHEAENWLARLNEAIVEGFGRLSHREERDED